MRGAGIALLNCTAYGGQNLMINDATKELKDVKRDPKKFLGTYYNWVKPLTVYEEVTSGTSVTSHLTVLAILSSSLVFQS